MEEPIWPSIGEQLTPYKLALGILLHSYVTTKDEICEECLHEAEEVSQVNMNSHSSFDVYATLAAVFVNMLRGADNRTLEIEPSLSDITSELEEKLKVGNVHETNVTGKKQSLQKKSACHFFFLASPHKLFDFQPIFKN